MIHKQNKNNGRHTSNTLVEGYDEDEGAKPIQSLKTCVFRASNENPGK